MGFNKKRVPPLNELIALLENDPQSLNRYMNADSIVGPTESVDYVLALIRTKLEKEKNLAAPVEDL